MRPVVAVLHSPSPDGRSSERPLERGDAVSARVYNVRVVIRDSVEWIVWAVPAGSEGAPVEGRGARQDNRLFLDEPAGVCYCFSELSGKASPPFHVGRDGACDSARNEKGVKPLKTNNSVKWPISHPQ
jgi:hypothetical protein